MCQIELAVQHFIMLVSMGMAFDNYVIHQCLEIVCPLLFSHSDLVELLIQHGASLNAFDKRDRQALHWASYMGHVAVVKILLQFGAEVNIRDKDLYSPLHAVNVAAY